MNDFVKEILVKSTPRKLLGFYQNRHPVLSDIFTENAYLSYSQQGEDFLLKRYFKGRTNGFYVDIGAYHPRKYSNTKIFYDLGWKGINIDPNPESISLFKNERKRDINLNIGIGPNNSTLSYHMFNHGAVNTFSKKHAEAWEKVNAFRLERVIDVELKKLSDVLDMYMAENTKIDFMNIDVEGLDLEVLESNNWDKYKPSIILIEDTNLTVESRNSKVFNFLKKTGYSLYAINGITSIYSKDSL